MPSMIDDACTIRTGGESEPLMLLLHGYGSNEKSLPRLMSRLPSGMASVSVRAPRTVGSHAFAWAPIQVPGRPDPAAVHESTLALLTWLDDQIAEDRPIVPLGFSQGGLMVSQLMRARPERFTGGVVLAGLLLDEPADGDAALVARQMPVFFGHGDADQVIPADATSRASVWISAHAAMTERIYPGLDHSISSEMLDDVAAFLRKHVSIPA
jgi:phospholipase/carboxylesterase